MRFFDGAIRGFLLGCMAAGAGCSSSHAAVMDKPDSSSPRDSSGGTDVDPKVDARAPTDSNGCSPCDSGHDMGSSVVDGGHDVDPPPVDAGHDAASPKPVHKTGQSIMVTTKSGVQNRTYDITIPVGCDASHPMPIVFVFHGDGGNGAGMYAAFPIEAAAAAAGGTAMFVYPDGLNNNLDPSNVPRAWNLYTDPGFFPYSMGDPTGNNDIDFFDAMLSFFETTYCVDTSRIFITGMSSGGYLANQFARWRSDVVKGTAPQSGGAPFGNLSSSGQGAASDWQPPNYCVGPTKPVPALIIHGSADGTVDECNGVEAEAYWSLANGCTNAAANCVSNADDCTGSNLSNPPATPTAAASPSPCVASQGCGSPVVFCVIPGMGHSIWQNAPETIWGFFASL